MLNNNLPTNVRYLETAAKKSRRNSDLWIRYLVKFTKNGKITLSHEDFMTLLARPFLDDNQRAIIVDFMNYDTQISRYIRSLNQPYNKEHVKNVLEERMKLYKKEHFNLTRIKSLI